MTLILLNVKLYKEGFDRTLLQKFASVKVKGYEVVVAPPLTLTGAIKGNVFAQHVDPVGFGAHTGHVSVDGLNKLGVKGVILNHSEFKIPLKELEETVTLCKKKKLTTVVCASTISEIKKIAKICPDYISYEPKELIGGNVSVTAAKPGVIVKAVETVKEHCKAKVLCGAGIHSKEDVGQAVLLGCSGVMIGHAVPKAKNPVKFLKSLLL